MLVWNLWNGQPSSSIPYCAAIRVTRVLYGTYVRNIFILNVIFQEGEHSSVQDAQATMRLYTMFRKEWENELLKKRQKNLVNDVLLNNSRDQQPKPNKKSSKEKSTQQDSSNKRFQYEDSDSD